MEEKTSAIKDQVMHLSGIKTIMPALIRLIQAIARGWTQREKLGVRTVLVRSRECRPIISLLSIGQKDILFITSLLKWRNFIFSKQFWTIFQNNILFYLSRTCYSQSSTRHDMNFNNDQYSFHSFQNHH